MAVNDLFSSELLALIFAPSSGTGVKQRSHLRQMASHQGASC